MTTRKIVLKKVKVGTPIRTVTAGSFGINNLGGVNTGGRTSGSLLAFNQSSGNFEPVTLTGDSNHFITYDSSGTPDTLQINFTNDSISGSLIPKLDSAFDLGSSTKKWKDLFLSGSTITLGDLTIASTGGGIEVKDSDGNTLLQNIKYITVNGDTDILAYDSSTSTFTFNDSDIARTDEIETFHKAIKVTDSAEITSNLTVGGNLTVVGDLQYDDVSADSAVFSGSVAIGNNLTADSSTINKIANTTLTGQNATFDSATIGNLAVTNLVISSGDSAFFSKVGVGDLEVDSANIDRLTLDSGQVRQLSTGFINADSAFMDSATISTIATGSINADQQFTDSATITNLANSVLTAKVITGDSATIGNVAVTTQLTGNQANFDSVASNTLHANSLSVDSGDIRQLSVDFINADSAFLDSATITNLSTSQITLSQTTIDSATINTLNADSSDIRQFSTEFINFDSAFGDSATITNIANTQLTGSQATFDSATITNLNVDSSDIRQLSTEFINVDSAFIDSATIGNIAITNAVISSGDSATFTSLANSTFTGKVITGTNVAFDSARIGSIGIGGTDITTSGKIYYANVFSGLGDLPDASSHHGMFAHVHATGGGYFAHGGAWHRLLDSSTTAIQRVRALLSDSATINNLAAGTINVDNINIGDSATFTNLASTQFTGSQATLDSATIGGIHLTSNDITTTGKIYYANVFSTEGDLPSASTYHGMFAHVHATGKGYFAHGGAWHQLLDKSSANDSATITNLASGQLTVDNATFDSSAHNTIHAGAVTIDSATIINLANTQFTSSQITSDSATINTLNADSSDIRQFSTEFINFDSAFGDSATITNIANSVLTAKAITNTTLVGDSATITNIASSQLTGGSASFSGDVILDSSGAIQFDKSDQALEFGDNYKATFGSSADLQIHHDGNNKIIGSSGYLRLAATNGVTYIDGNNVQIRSGDGGENLAKFLDNGAVELYHDNSKKLETTSTGTTITGLMASTTATADSGTIGNLATTQITGSQATFDSADIGNLRTTGVLQTDSVNATQLELLTGVTNAPAHKEGRLFYDDSNKTIGFYSDVSGLVHEVGIEEHQRVYNNSGATITKGKPVYFSGNYTGGAVDVPTVALADATDTAKYNAQGLTAVAIPNNSYGYIQTSGQLSGLDTSGLTAGQKVFVGLGSGLLSNSTPLYPNYPICLGWCVSSNASTGVILLNRQAHTIDSLRVVTSGHIGSNLQIDGNLTVLGSTTSVSSADLTAGTPMFRLNEGNAIGEAGTTFSGTGLDDAFYSGFFTGTTNQNYYVRIDGVGTGAGGVDTFEVAFGADSTFSSPVLTKQVITGSPQMIHSTDNISINFASTTGHDSGARWAGTAGPINVDTGFFSNRNTGTSGVGFTYVGIYYDVSDDKWKLIDEYDSNPSGSINEADASYSLGTLKLDTLEGNVTGNVTGNVSGTAATVTGAAQSNITSVGTLTGLTIGGDLTLDSAGAVVYDKSEQALTFGDNHKAKFGTGGDLQIYHNGANSFIEDGGTGNLVIRSNLVDIQSADGSENLAKFTENSSVKLYFNGSEKLSTSNTGVSVTGLMASTTATADSATIGNLAVTNLVVSSGDSATITNIASSSINTNALQVDDITIDGSTISDGGDFKIDAGGDIRLDADGADIILQDNGTDFGKFTKNGNDLELKSMVTNGDFKIIGERTAGTVNALTFDMSDGGAASFNSKIISNNLQLENGFISQTSGDLTLDVAGDITLDADGGDIKLSNGGTQFANFGDATGAVHIDAVVSDDDIKFRGVSDGTTFTALTLDMSDRGNAIFGAGATFNRRTEISTDSDYQLRIDNGSNIWYNRVQGDGTYAIHLNGTGNIFDATATGIGVTGNADVSGTLTVGNLNVDSADIIKIARDNLSTGQAGLTYDSSGGQFGLNANHVMALIQTVDSNGSGLNAATLDGQEGTHYRINVYDNSGTLLN